MTLPRDYDAWRLQGPDEDRHEIGTEDGDACGRWSEPDEDCPVSMRCNGTIYEMDGTIYCGSCDWIAS